MIKCRGACYNKLHTAQTLMSKRRGCGWGGIGVRISGVEYVGILCELASKSYHAGWLGRRMMMGMLINGLICVLLAQQQG